MEKKKKVTNEEVLAKLSLILPFLPDEGKKELVQRFEGMGDILDVFVGKKQKTESPA